MIPSRPERKLWRPITLALAAGLLVAGCGDNSGLERRYKVSGTVTLKGKPVNAGLINFTPVAPEGRPATGAIAGGRYRLTTIIPNDGALPGSYQVSIVSDDIDMGQLDKFQKDENREMAVIAIQKTSKKVVPAKYNKPNTSGLTAEVKPETNEFNFDLTESGTHP